MNKKFLSKLLATTFLICGINFLPVNFCAENFKIISVAHAEVKNFTASATATFSFGEDDEKIVAAVKNVAKMRAEQAAKEKFSAYVKTANKNLSDEDISALTNNFSEFVDVEYEKFFVSENAFETDDTGKENFMYEATVTIKVDADKISEYLELGKQDKANIIQQNKSLQKSIADISKNFDDLSEGAENFSAEELDFELSEIDKKISAQEKLIEGNKFYFQKDF